MDTHTTAAELPRGDLAAAPGPRRRNPYVRFLRGLLEGVGFVAIVAGGLTYSAFNRLAEGEDLREARQKYETLASRVCPPARRLSDTPNTASGPRPPMEGGAEIPYVLHAEQYECLTGVLARGMR